MALEIEYPPAEGGCFGTKEPYEVKVTVDNPDYITVGAKERYRFQFGTQPAVGDSMAITLTSPALVVNIDFTTEVAAETQPIDFPTHINIPAPTGGQTTEHWIDNVLVPFLLGIEGLDGYDLFRSGSNYINLLAKEEASNRVTSLSATGFTGSGSHLTSGIAQSIDESYFVKMQILMTEQQSTGYYNLISPWFYYRPEIVSGDAIVKVNIEDVLDGMMKELDVVANESTSSTVLYSARNWRIRTAEYVQGGEDAFFVYSSKSATLVKGGRRFLDNASTIISTQFKFDFITLREDPWVDRRLSDWLYFFEPDTESGQTLRMRATVKGAWGTSAGLSVTTITPGQVGKIHRVPAGYDQLGLQSLLGDEEPIYYDIAIHYQDGTTLGDEVIGPFRFYVNPESETRMGLHYFNFLGLMEAQVLDAPVEFVNAWENNVAMLAKPQNAVSAGSGMEVHKERALQSFHQLQANVNTGPLSARNWIAAQDVLNSERVWLVNLQGDGGRLAAMIQKGSEKMTPYSVDGVNFHGLGFSIKLNKEKGNSVPERLIS